MFFVWRGFGWVIPIIIFASLLVAQLCLDAVFGEGYYETNKWSQIVAILAGSILVGALGYLLNYKKRIVVVNNETGEIQRSSSHTLFFIPIEFWAVIIPVIFLWAQSSAAEQDSQDIAYIKTPVINDKYLVDYTKIFKNSSKEFKYGIMKVTSIYPQGVEVLVSEMAYDKKSGVKNDIRNNKTNDINYFSKDTTVFRKDDLVNFKNSDAIYSVYRN